MQNPHAEQRQPWEIEADEIVQALSRRVFNYLMHLSASDWDEHGVTEAGFKALMVAACHELLAQWSVHIVTEEPMRNGHYFRYPDLHLRYSHGDFVIHLILEFKYVNIHYIREGAAGNVFGTVWKFRRDHDVESERKTYHEAASMIRRLSVPDLRNIIFRDPRSPKGKELLRSVPDEIKKARDQLDGYIKLYQTKYPDWKHDKIRCYAVVGVGSTLLSYPHLDTCARPNQPAHVFPTEGTPVAQPYPPVLRTVAAVTLPQTAPAKPAASQVQVALVPKGTTATPAPASAKASVAISPSSSKSATSSSMNNTPDDEEEEEEQ